MIDKIICISNEDCSRFLRQFSFLFSRTFSRYLKLEYVIRCCRLGITFDFFVRRNNTIYNDTNKRTHDLDTKSIQMIKYIKMYHYFSKEKQ